MKQLRDILGYFLGFVLFVGLMPTLMWLASGRPAFWSEVATKDVVAWGLMLCGLLLSIWTIVYMKRRGNGNPMHKTTDAPPSQAQATSATLAGRPKQENQPKGKKYDKAMGAKARARQARAVARA